VPSFPPVLLFTGVSALGIAGVASTRTYPGRTNFEKCDIIQPRLLIEKKKKRGL
jgi:hypothetical protein